MSGSDRDLYKGAWVAYGSEPTTDAGLRLSEDEPAWRDLARAAETFYENCVDGFTAEPHRTQYMLALFRALSRALVDRDTGISVDEAHEGSIVQCEGAAADCWDAGSSCRGDAERWEAYARVLRAVRGTDGD